jgi:hypothetical protein
LEITTPAGTFSYHAVSGGSDTGGEFQPITTTITGKLVYAQPAEGCGPFTNPSAIRGKIALIDRGTCEFEEKIYYAAAAGAIAAVIVNNTSGFPPIMLGSPVDFPAIMILHRDGDAIKAALKTISSASIASDTSPTLQRHEDEAALNPSIFGFYVAQPGLYPFRSIWVDPNGSVSAEWFSVALNGNQILLNDRDNPNSLKTYQARKSLVEPVISVAADGDAAVLRFEGVLQSADQVQGPYKDEPASTSPFRVPFSTGNVKFWRSRQ